MNPMLWAFQGVPVNLFFALVPPATADSAMEALIGTLQQAHHLRGHRIASDRRHNTLVPVHDGKYTLEENIERAKWVGTRITYPSFPVWFEWTESFNVHRQRYPLVLRGEDGVRPLVGFQQQLREQMARAGFAVPRNYTPHITLLWADRCVDEYPIAPIGWTVRDFVLVMSHVGASQHIHLGHWRLH